jgi:hypothetical protein
MWVGLSRGAFQIYIKLPLVIRDSVVVDLVGNAELLHRFGPRCEEIDRLTGFMTNHGERRRHAANHEQHVLWRYLKCYPLGPVRLLPANWRFERETFSKTMHRAHMVKANVVSCMPHAYYISFK